MDLFVERTLAIAPHESPDLEQRLRLELERALDESGSVKLPHIARKIAMSPRTLQRRLRERDLSFGVVADQVRRERALSMLESGERTVPDVASALGYRDPRHLFRLVRRWTGTTPSMLRCLPLGEQDVAHEQTCAEQDLAHAQVS